MNQYILKKQNDFIKVIELFKKEIASLRTGRASPAILDGVQVEAYGAKTPLVGLATINLADARSLVVIPWDRNIIKEIEKALTVADLGLSLIAEGDKIRLILPMLTEENRRQLVKKLNEKMESSRINLRLIRDEIKEAIEKAFKNKEINEDDKFRFIKELEDEISRQNELLKKIRDKKEEEVMTI